MDGNTDGASGACTRTLASAGPWWEVDLGAPTEVSDVVVWGCANCSDPLRDFRVLVGDEACVIASSSRRESVAHCNGMRGSKVRVELREGNAPLVLCEVEVHGLAPRRRKGVGAGAESRHYAKDGRVLTVKAGAPPVVALGTTLYLSGATSAVTAVLVLGRLAVRAAVAGADVRLGLYIDGKPADEAGSHVYSTLALGASDWISVVVGGAFVLPKGKNAIELRASGDHARVAHADIAVHSFAGVRHRGSIVCVSLNRCMAPLYVAW